MGKINKKEALELSLSDFSWNVDHENIGKQVRINKPEDEKYHNREGEIAALYRSEEDMSVDAYWIIFEPEDFPDDLWFLPGELEILDDKPKFQIKR